MQLTKDTNNIRCRICGNHSDNIVLTGTDILKDIGREFPFHQCSSCKCLQITEFPSDIGRFYEGSYYSMQSDPFEALSTWGKRVDRTKDYLILFYSRLFCSFPLAKHLHRKWLTMIHWNRKQRILDIGCGNGILIRRLQRLGFQNLLGVDAFIDSDVSLGRNVWLRKKTIEETEGQFDIVVMSHSLEHMPDQQIAMKSVKRLLAPGGKIAVMIPIFSEHFFETYGECWYSWDVPRHFYLHTIDSFAKLVSDSGLKIEKKVLYSFPACLIESERRLATLRKDPGATERIRAFSHAKWIRETNKINEQGKSDSCNFLLTHL